MRKVTHYPIYPKGEVGASSDSLAFVGSRLDLRLQLGRWY
ncbi:hypothetical protein HMPREF1556_01771 [Porphyromonas sp. oral taxon 278 str. W7784]|nr:hypothetical protein HMPREF1556_01771 [Porphyromonas sp. oral taxon 278 str. W7784]